MAKLPTHELLKIFAEAIPVTAKKKEVTKKVTGKELIKNGQPQVRINDKLIDVDPNKTYTHKEMKEVVVNHKTELDKYWKKAKYAGIVEYIAEIYELKGRMDAIEQNVHPMYKFYEETITLIEDAIAFHQKLIDDTDKHIKDSYGWWSKNVFTRKFTESVEARYRIQLEKHSLEQALSIVKRKPNEEKE
jgi:hypothetical protein